MKNTTVANNCYEMVHQSSLVWERKQLICLWSLKWCIDICLSFFLRKKDDDEEEEQNDDGGGDDDAFGYRIRLQWTTFLCMFTWK